MAQLCWVCWLTPGYIQNKRLLISRLDLERVLDFYAASPDSKTSVCLRFPSSLPLRVYVERGTCPESFVMRKACFCVITEVSRSLPHPPFPETDADTEWNIIEGLLSRKDCAYEPAPHLPSSTGSSFLILAEGPLYLVLLWACQEKWMWSPSVFWRYRCSRRKLCIIATVRKNHAQEQFLLARKKNTKKSRRDKSSPLVRLRTQEFLRGSGQVASGWGFSVTTQSPPTFSSHSALAD